MSEKSKRSTPFRYESGDLAPADDAFADRFVERNREAINAGIRAARASIKKGKGKRFEVTDDLVSHIAKVRQRVRRRKA